MSVLTVVMPDNSQVDLHVAPNTLIFNGMEYVEPKEAKYVMLYDVLVVANSLSARASVSAFVISFNVMSEPTTDPRIISASDPGLGMCTCFVTCQGTNLHYTKVTNSD